MSSRHSKDLRWAWETLHSSGGHQLTRFSLLFFQNFIKHLQLLLNYNLIYIKQGCFLFYRSSSRNVNSLCHCVSKGLNIKFKIWLLTNLLLMWHNTSSSLKFRSSFMPGDAWQRSDTDLKTSRQSCQSQKINCDTSGSSLNTDQDHFCKITRRSVSLKQSITKSK